MLQWASSFHSACPNHLNLPSQSVTKSTSSNPSNSLKFEHRICISYGQKYTTCFKVVFMNYAILPSSQDMWFTWVSHLVFMPTAKSYLSHLTRFNSRTTDHQRHSNVELVHLPFVVRKWQLAYNAQASTTANNTTDTDKVKMTLNHTPPITLLIKC